MVLPFAAFFSCLALFFITHANAKYQPSGLSVSLIPIFAPESPFHRKNLNDSNKMETLFEMSKGRRFASPQIHAPVQHVGGLYYVNISLGSPPKPQLLLLDTGSDLTWTLCLPCPGCANPRIPHPNPSPSYIFDPKSSTSYQAIPCGPLCQRPYICKSGKCSYNIRYLGGFSTQLFASRETFTFPSNTKQYTSFPLLLFGCSHSDANFVSGINGLMGMDQGPLSVINLLGRKLGARRFSYCLAPGFETTTVLKFAGDAVMPTDKVQKTRILNKGKGFYLNIEYVSVGDTPMPGNRIKLTGTDFIIDSGSDVSYIIEPHYKKVMTAFDEHFKDAGRRRYTETTDFEYCYEYDEGFKSYPKMTFHFGGDRSYRGADFVVSDQLYYIDKVEKYFCVALRESKISDKASFLGAMQQQDKRILYDLDASELHFSPEKCINDRPL